MKTRLIYPTPAGIAEAVQTLRDGGLLALPTETVYGLAADATNDGAVAAVFRSKGRPSFNPLIVHVADIQTMRSIVDLPEFATPIITAFMPGPLSIVARLRPDAGLSGLVSAGLETVAVRIPAHPVARDLLRAFGGPVAAPSANPSGKLSPTSAAHVMDALGGKISAVLDGGSCDIGLESTILDVSGPAPVLLRAGGVAIEDIEAITGPISRNQTPQKPAAPGQLASHYAPEVAVRINAVMPLEKELLLGFGPNCPDAALNLSKTGDVGEAAANLFSMLRQLDNLARAQGKTAIAVAPVPNTGLGLAINDRLKRAAAPRQA
jgi:L-threonylcarbamoyladenylate synthase